MSESLRGQPEAFELPQETHEVPEGRRERGPSAENEIMYRLPGDEQLTERDFSRYRVAMETFRLDSGDEARRLLDSDDYRVRLKGGALLETAEEVTPQEYAALEADVIRECNGLNMDAFDPAMRTIGKLPPDARERVFANLFANPDMQQYTGFVMQRSFELAPEQRRTWLERGLQSKGQARHTASSGFRYLSRADLTETLPEYLATGMYGAEQVRLIADLGPEEQTNMIDALLSKGADGSRLKALAKNLSALDESAVARAGKSIGAALEQQPVSEYAALIRFADAEIRPQLEARAVESIAAGLGYRSAFERQAALRAARGLSEEARAKLEPALQAERVRLSGELRADDLKARRDAALLIADLAPAERVPLMPDVFEAHPDDHRSLRSALSGMEGLSPEERAAFVAEHPDFFAAFEKDASRTPLYGKAPSKFYAAEFEKGGSKTILLDSVPGMPDVSLKNRVIVRRVEDSTIPAWQRAYEASDFWKAKGFDYVPVEPIVNVRAHHGTEEASVATRVLPGVSLGNWREMSGLYRDQLLAQRDKIVRSLEQLGVEHGHADHDHNFVTVLERDADGKADFTKPPRLYVIDFDRSETFEPADPVPGVSGT